MTAPFTADERARLDAIEGAAWTEESVRERMAVAMADVVHGVPTDLIRAMADAALAVIRTPVEAVR